METREHMIKSHARRLLRHRVGMLTMPQCRELSERIIENLYNVQQFSEADSFFVYLAISTQVRTDNLIKKLLQDGKSVAAPKALGEGYIESVHIENLDDIMTGKYGVIEPKDITIMIQPDACIAPCLGVSERFERIGIGDGFYDRYISRHPHTPVIVLAYDRQVFKSLPTEKHDEPVDVIVTEKRVLYRKDGRHF